MRHLTVYFKVLAYLLNALNIASACEFEESRRSEIISPIPFAGSPFFFFVIRLYKAPAQAPLLPGKINSFSLTFAKF